MTYAKKKPKTFVLNFFLLRISGFLCLSFSSGFLCGSLFAISLCFCSSSFFSSLLSGSSQLSSSLSTFLSDCSCFRLVGLYLLSEERLRSSSFLVCLSLADLACLSIFLSFPSVETLLCLFLAATPPSRCFISSTPSLERIVRTVSVGCAPTPTQ